MHHDLLVVQNYVRPPNLIGWDSYELDPIKLNGEPSEFVVIPNLKGRQRNALSINNVASLMTLHEGQTQLTCLSHRFVSMI